MKFEWDDIKTSELTVQIEIIEMVSLKLTEYYDIDEIYDLNSDQITEISTFANTIPNSILYIGFKRILEELEKQSLAQNDQI